MKSLKELYVKKDGLYNKVNDFWTVNDDIAGLTYTVNSSGVRVADGTGGTYLNFNTDSTAYKGYRIEAGSNYYGFGELILQRVS